MATKTKTQPKRPAHPLSKAARAKKNTRAAPDTGALAAQVHVSPSAIAVFSREIQRILELHGDTRTARTKIGHLAASQPHVLAAITAQRVRSHRPGAKVTKAGVFEQPNTSSPATATRDQHQADQEAVLSVLRRIVKPEAVEPWLNKSIPSLGNRKPMDIIRAGEANRVIELLTQIEEGIHI